MKHQVGDRYEWTRGKAVDFIHTLEYVGDNSWQVIDCGPDCHHKIGTKFKNSHGISHNGWKYLGNFGKSDNYNNLYSILNENPR